MTSLSSSGVTARAGGEGTRLRVAASLTVAEYLMPGWVSALQRESPDAALAVEVSRAPRVLAQVRHAGADIGFTEGNQNPLEGLLTSTVRGDRLAVVAYPGHPWTRRARPVAGAELVAADLIVPARGTGPREVLDDALSPWGGARPWREPGSTARILAAARRGDGPAVLSEPVIADDVDLGRLAVVRTEEVDLSRALRAVWAPDRPLLPLARRLLALAGEPAREVAP